MAYRCFLEVFVPRLEATWPRISVRGLGEVARGDVRASAAPTPADHLPHQRCLDPEAAAEALNQKQ